MTNQGMELPGRICPMWRKSNSRPPRTSRAMNVGGTVLLALMLAAPAAAAAADPPADAPAQPPAADEPDFAPEPAPQTEREGVTDTATDAQTDAADADVDSFDEALARQAYRVAEVWLQQAEVPSASAMVSIPTRDLLAVHVTLRHEGRRLGQGSARVDDPHTADESRIEIMPLIRTAMRTALREAATELESSTRLLEMAADLELDIQFAHGLSRLNLESLEDLPDRFTPGLHGLAMRRGDEWAYTFPGSAIATNSGLRSQLNRMLASLDLPLDRLAVVGTEEGPPLYRFDAVHLIRTDPDDTAESLLSLHRGNRLLPPLPLDDTELTDLTDRLLQHLLGRYRGNDRFHGTYQPTANIYAPVHATPIEAATAIYALARASKLERLDADRRETAVETARTALARLTHPQADDEQRVTDDLAASAMALIALLETPGAAGDLREQRASLADTLLSNHQSDGTFREPGRDSEVSIAAHALAAAALVRLYDRTREPDLLEKAHLTIDAVWARLADPRRATDAMPWLVIAELDLDRLDRPTGYRQRLVDITGDIWRYQLQPWHEQAQRSADLVGGFAITDALVTEPTWQSAGILAGQARMLHDPSLIDDDRRPAWLVHTALGARFLAQLTMDEHSAFYAHQPERAVGGTRTAFWNNRQPLAATALSLLATTELEAALNRLSEN